jgi:hypothetical protein
MDDGREVIRRGKWFEKRGPRRDRGRPAECPDKAPRKANAVLATKIGI